MCDQFPVPCSEECGEKVLRGMVRSRTFTGPGDALNHTSKFYMLYYFKGIVM